MRTAALAFSLGKMNVVSERLNWRASACMVSSSSPRPSSKTQSGLPERRLRPSVKTLSRHSGPEESDRATERRASGGAPGAPSLEIHRHVYGQQGPEVANDL